MNDGNICWNISGCAQSTDEILDILQVIGFISVFVAINIH